MCRLCPSGGISPAHLDSRRRALWTLGAAGLWGPAAWAQVQVGEGSRLKGLVPAQELEQAARQQYAEVIAKARAEGRLLRAGDAPVRRVRAIAQRLVPQATPWNARAAQWAWEIHVIRSDEINAWCMPGGKIAVYTGLLEQLRLTDDEVAMMLGHEMAHALREHARAQIAKQTATGAGLSIVTSLLGLGEVGQTLASMGGQLLVLKFSRNDESEADLVGLEIAARAGYNPQAAVTLWNKMLAGGAGRGGFLSTHPSGPDRVRQLQANLGKVQGLYERSRATAAPARLPPRSVGTELSTTAPQRPPVQPAPFQTPVGQPLQR